MASVVPAPTKTEDPMKTLHEELLRRAKENRDELLRQAKEDRQELLRRAKKTSEWMRNRGAVGASGEVEEIRKME